MISKRWCSSLYLVMALFFVDNMSDQAHIPQVIAGVQPAQANSNPPDITFKEMDVGDAKSKEGVRLSFHDWKSSDGVGVTSFIFSYDSPDQASEGLAKRLGEASKIMERGPGIDKSSEKTGDWAVATFLDPRTKQETSEVL